MWRPGLRHDPLVKPEQVFNAPSSVAVSPTSDARADAVKAAWAPVLTGQAVPLLWERDLTPDVDC